MLMGFSPGMPLLLRQGNLRSNPHHPRHPRLAFAFAVPKLAPTTRVSIELFLAEVRIMHKLALVITVFAFSLTVLAQNDSQPALKSRPQAVTSHNEAASPSAQ